MATRRATAVARVRPVVSQAPIVSRWRQATPRPSAKRPTRATHATRGPMSPKRAVASHTSGNPIRLLAIAWNTLLSRRPARASRSATHCQNTA